MWWCVDWCFHAHSFLLWFSWTKDGNKITAIPKEIGNLTSLQSLKLSEFYWGCVLFQDTCYGGLYMFWCVDWCFHAHPFLLWLFLTKDENYIKAIPKEISNLMSLQSLQLSEFHWEYVLFEDALTCLIAFVMMCWLMFSCTLIFLFITLHKRWE